MFKITRFLIACIFFGGLSVIWAQASASPENFSFIVASDIHVDRIQQVEGNENERKLAWLLGAELTWESVLALAGQAKTHSEQADGFFPDPPAFAFFNGDVTDCALPEEWQLLEKSFLSGPLPIFLGLGNHDYASQPKRCVRAARKLGSESFLAKGSLARMKELTKTYAARTGVKNFSLDLQSQAGEWRGSMAYSFDYGGVHFVELQYSPTYAARLKNAASNYQIRPSSSWLERDLARAGARGLPAILNLHDLNYLADEQVDRILAQYPPAAIFCGHSHRVQQGYYAALKKKIPVFDSGVFYRGYYFYIQLSPKGIKVNYVRGNSGIPIIYKSLLLPWQNAFADQ